QERRGTHAQVAGGSILSLCGHREEKREHGEREETARHEGGLLGRGKTSEIAKRRRLPIRSGEPRWDRGAMLSGRDNSRRRYRWQPKRRGRAGSGPGSRWGASARSW